MKYQNEPESFVLTEEDEPKENEIKPSEAPKHKCLWPVIIAVIVLLAFLVLKVMNLYSKQPHADMVNDYANAVETVAFDETEEPTQEFTELPTDDPIKTESEFKDNCTETGVEKIARKPYDYIGKQVKITGCVTSVSGVMPTLVVIKPSETDDVSYQICAEIWIHEHDTRVFKGDNLTCWGVLEGTELYVKANNQTIELPTLDVEYYEIKQ